jgi:hypothetical protein
MTPLTSWLDELLACTDDVLHDELVDRILARGDAARDSLLDVATSPQYRGLGSPGEGLAAVHALDVLAEMPADDATAARLLQSLVDDPESDVAQDVVDALYAMGDVAAPHALAALGAATNPDAAWWLATVLTGTNVRDDATFAALCAAFERFPADVAPALADYGDERALPVLRRVFDAHVVEAGHPAEHEDRCINAAHAIEALAGGLTAAEAEKLHSSLARQNRLLRRTVKRLGAAAEEYADQLVSARRLSPNDPCPCGSGRKFKKCHEGDEAFDPRAGDDDPELA